MAKNTFVAEVTFKHSEKHYENYVDNIVYKVSKQQLDAIYEEKAKGMIIRSKCNWFEHGKKSTKFFLNYEKNSAIHPMSNTFCHILSFLNKMKLQIRIK